MSIFSQHIGHIASNLRASTSFGNEVQPTDLHLIELDAELVEAVEMSGFILYFNFDYLLNIVGFQANPCILKKPRATKRFVCCPWFFRMIDRRAFQSS